MKRTLETKLRTAWLRCGCNVLLQQTATAVALAGAAAGAGVLAQRLFGVTVINAWSVWGLAAAAAILTAALVVLHRPDRMQVALLVDRRLGVRERFSTALALAGNDDPFARAAVDEAHKAAERLDVAQRFPVRPSRRWLLAVAPWAAAVGAFLFLPDLDVLGVLADREKQQAQAAELTQARQEVAQAVSKVRTAVQQSNNKAIEAELAKLGDLTQGAKPAEVRRDAIRKLTNLAERLRDLQSSDRLQSADQMRDLLKQLHGTPNGLSRELDQALARGNFKKAGDLLREMMSKANDGKLSEADRKKLADQLARLAEQLDKLANEQKAGEDLLQQEGLSAETAKKLAGMTPQELREALKKQGLTDEQIDKLLEKMAACRQACRSCGKLGKAMAQCRGAQGQLTAGELVGLIEALRGMELLEGELAGLQAALQDVELAMARLGEGQCQGGLGGLCDGNSGLFKPGGSDKQGMGPGGGRARAWGNRPTGGPEDVGVNKTGVNNQPSDDQQIIASWLFKGPQAKGVSKRKLTDAVRSAKDAAAEAISDNKIPRKYESAVKDYFGRFEGATKDANAGEKAP